MQRKPGGSYARGLSRARAAACIIPVLAVIVAGCGSSSSKATSKSSIASTGSSASNPGLAAATAFVNSHIKNPTTIAPTTPIGKPIPTGKRIVFLNCGPAGCTEAAAAFKQAAAKLGWTTTILTPPQPTPQLVQADMDQAVRLHPDAVVVSALPEVEYSRQAAELKADHIPLFAMFGTDQTGTNDIGLQLFGSNGDNQLAAAIADKTIVDVGGKGTIGQVILSGYPIIAVYTAAYDAEIKKDCPACKIVSTTITPTSLGTTDGTDIVNFLRANPGIKALFLSYEQIGEDLTSAAASAGLTLPKTYSVAPTIQGVEAARSGVRTATAPADYNMIAWQMADALARQFTGGNPLIDQTFPPPVIWSKQYNNIPTPPNADTFPAEDPNYQQQFEKLWGKS